MMPERWTKMAGITSDGESVAEKMLVHMIEAMKITPNVGFAQRVFDEAAFRVFDLPIRTASYQRAYLEGQKP